MKKSVKRKIRKYIVFAPVLVCAIAVAIYAGLFMLTDDKKAPEITIDALLLEVPVAADDAALLQGIHAKDNVDGDVTSSILIEKISGLSKEKTATVTYAAFDRSGNVAKATRTIHYSDYMSPRFTQEKALVLSSNSGADIVKFMGAEDQIDGDLSNQVKGTLLSNVSNLNTPGVYDVEFRVTNSMNDTAYITLPVEVYANGTYNASVELSQYLVYIKAGDSFRPEEYLENLIVGNHTYPLKNLNPRVSYLSEEEIRQLGNNREDDVRTYINHYVDPQYNVDPFVHIVNVEMDNDVDADKPGVYSVTYTIDYKGIYKAYTRLNVVVEES